VRRRHIAIEGADRTLETEYWPNGAVKRHRMADGNWTGLYGYDGFGRLVSLDNAQPASSAEPDLFVTATTWNARGQTETIAYGYGATATYTYNPQRGLGAEEPGGGGPGRLADALAVGVSRALVTKVRWTFAARRTPGRYRRHRDPGRGDEAGGGAGGGDGDRAAGGVVDQAAGGDGPGG